MRTSRLAGIAMAAMAALGLGAGAAAADDFDVVRQVSVGNAPGPVISGYGAGWVINQTDNTVTRIDSTTGTTRTISVGQGAVAMATAANSVWVLTGQGSSTATIYRLNGSTGAVQKTIRAALPIPAGDFHQGGIGPAGGYIWAGANDQKKLVRIDYSNNKASIRATPSSYEGFATGDGKIWTTVFSGSRALLQSWNPKTLKVEKSINIDSINDGTGEVFLTYGSSQIYFSEVEPNDDGATTVIDVGKSRIGNTFTTNIELQCTVTGNNALWVGVDYDVLSGETAKVAALNEDNLSVLRQQQPFPTGSTNGAVGCVAAGSGYVWVPDGQSPGSVYQLISSTTSSS